jgi:hypothetical protein
MRILELGSYVAPAYAGMILAEQGHAVTKWIYGPDPIEQLRGGDALWSWINYGKRIIHRSARFVPDALGDFDAVLDNFRPGTLARFALDPARLAATAGVRWVSLRADIGDVSFDAVAQMRAWGNHAPYLPFYIGDTTAGLWLAFKLLAGSAPGHYTVMQAAALAKLVEGENVVRVERDGQRVPWDVAEEYRYSADGVTVSHRGVTYREPPRDDDWRWNNLRHLNGRYQI